MLYIHIPYCEGKCLYCDFYSGGNPQWKIYVQALISELSERIGEIGTHLSSIYIGGGTPSLMPANDFEYLISEIKLELRKAGVTMNRDLEFTLEVNPEDIDEKHILSWLESGVNRISVGVQSFIDEELCIIKRRHTARKAQESVELLKKYFTNISLDIIYGLPLQTSDSLKQTLKDILHLKPSHISAYSLTYEPGTPLYLLRERGKISEAPEESYIEFGEIVDRTLEEAGFIHYEISNYSLPGMHSRHNSGYWEGKPYLGLGPSAHSYDGKRKRKFNPQDVYGYIKRYGNCKSEGDIKNQIPFFEEEILSDEELREEFIMVSLRTQKGLSLDYYETKFGERELKKLIKKSKKWEKVGDLELRESNLCLTKKGMNIADLIILELI